MWVNGLEEFVYLHMSMHACVLMCNVMQIRSQSECVNQFPHKIPLQSVSEVYLSSYHHIMQTQCRMMG